MAALATIVLDVQSPGPKTSLAHCKSHIPSASEKLEDVECGLKSRPRQQVNIGFRFFNVIYYWAWGCVFQIGSSAEVEVLSLHVVPDETKAPPALVNSRPPL